MTLRLHKDLLGLVFVEIDHGHDLMNFSEISRRCYQIFYRNLEVVKNVDNEGDPVIYTQQKLTKARHGVYRWWYFKGAQDYILCNYYYGKLHGRYRAWRKYGKLITDCNYHYGFLIEK